MPNRVTPLDLARDSNNGLENDSLLFNLLASIFPPTLISILAKISNFLWSTFTNHSNDPSSWLSTLLPPLLSLLLLYISLLAAYRTMRSTIRLFIFTIKWGVILGSLIAIYAVYTGSDQSLDSMGQVPISKGSMARGVGKALRWAGAGSMVPSLLATALPFLNANNQDPLATSNSRSGRSRTRTQNPNAHRRKRNRNQMNLNYNDDDDAYDHDLEEGLNSNPLLSGLESLISNLLDKNQEEDEESYYQRTGLRKDSIRSSSSSFSTSSKKKKNRNRSTKRKNQVGNEIHQAINDLTGLNLDLDVLDGNLNLEGILKGAHELLDGNDRERNARTRSGNQDGLVRSLIGKFLAR